MECPPLRRGDHPRGRAQGLQGRGVREARRHPHRAARGHHGDGARGRAAAAPQARAARAERTRAAEGRRHRPRGAEPGGARRQRRDPRGRGARAARVHPADRHPGRDHLHGQGRGRRRQHGFARNRRAAGRRLQDGRLRRGRRRDRDRLRPGRARAEELEPGEGQEDRPHRLGARRDRRVLHPGSRARRRHLPRALTARRGVPPRPALGRLDPPERRGPQLLREGGQGLVLADAAAARAVGDPPGARPRRHPRLGRRSAQALDRPDVPGLRAQHRADRQRARGHGLRDPRRDCRQARAPEPQGDRGRRRRRDAHELPGARDRGAHEDSVRLGGLGEPAVRFDRLEAGQEVRAPLRRRLHEPGLRSARKGVRNAGVALRDSGGLRADAEARARPRPPKFGCAAYRLFDRCSDQPGTRTRNGGDLMAVATNEQQVLESIPTQLYIAGEWVDGAEGETIAVEDPSTEETLVEVASGNKGDALKALEAAAGAQKEWAATPPLERGEILRRAYEAMKERADDLALLMTLEMGKPVEESKAEITYAADFFWYYAAEASRVDGHYGISYNGRGRVLVMQQPVGPTILITPWNFPMAMGTRKIGPAIAAGCTMVWKPAKQTPLCALALTH